MMRRVQILMGNKMATIFNLGYDHSFANRFTLLTASFSFSSFIFQGIIIGTVFLQVPKTTAAYFSRGGILFL